ncbi:MAG: acyltransferase [Nitrospirae bacterium]|nr:acyltransferase [Nitrospirota bacterium]
MIGEIAEITNQTNHLIQSLILATSRDDTPSSELTTVTEQFKSLAKRADTVRHKIGDLLHWNPWAVSRSHPAPKTVQTGAGSFKVKAVSKGQVPRWKKYAEWVIGKTTLTGMVKYELITCLLGNWPGAMGLYLRSKVYPWILGEVGSNVVFGRGITLRHPHKIRIGKNVTIDEQCVLDAKGATNKGISIGDEVFIGRNSIIYCKDGDIEIQPQANISSNCEVFSSNQVVVGKGTLIAAYCFIMSGGTYDYRHGHVEFADQDVYSKGPTLIGQGCWLGAKVVVLDHVSIGDGSVVGAGAVVTKDLPAGSVAVGMPARSVPNRDALITA